VTHNRKVESSQTSLKEGLERYFKVKIDRLPIRVHGRSIIGYPFPKDDEREDSQRTRSFLFLVLASLSARRIGFRKIIYIAENGQFAIHLPLTSARVGPFSTHTAHPQFIDLMQDIFRSVLGTKDLQILNPFLYKTKAEVLATVGKEIWKLFPLSVSCWRGSRLQTSNHCGECIPCLTRRIAVESLDLKFDEYERDLLKEDVGSLSEDDLGKRNLSDLLEFILHFFHSSPSKKDQIIENFPDLINEYIDQDEAIAMYVRFSKEAMKVLNRYRGIRPLIK
jgi:7-cyano-7-deazaguanine synthase in queuosine biosynthesis